MVVALGPGKFYGSSLPRPRFYTDVKLNESRVDPPPPVMDPLLSWANEAHWSMGGLSLKRHRLQGRIEGSIKRLRAQKEKTQRQTPSPPAARKPALSKPRIAGQAPPNLSSLNSVSSDDDDDDGGAVDRKVRETLKATPSPKRSVERRKRARRLGEEFDRIAEEQLKRPGKEGSSLASRARSRKLRAEKADHDEVVAVEVADRGKKVSAKRKEVFGEIPRRTSPRNKQ